MRRIKERSVSQDKKRLASLQAMTREKAHLECELAQVEKRRREIKKRVKDIDAAMHLESLDQVGPSAITAGEMNPDVVGKIGGGR